MISVAEIPTTVMNHLSQVHDEQMGQLLQSNQAAGMGGRVAQNEAAQSPAVLGLTSLLATQMASSIVATGIPALYQLAAERGSIQSASAQPGIGLFDDTARRVAEREWRQDREQSSQKEPGQEQEIARLMENEAWRAIVQIALMIQQRGMYSQFMIIDLYQEDVGRLASAPSQMIVVASMDESSQQIAAHATLVQLDSSGKSVTRRLAGQLVWGQCSFAPDWVAMHLERETGGDGAWRLSADGLRDRLTGVALATDSIPALVGNSVDVSLHLPGAAQYWVTL